jgi:hypothetical protein
MNERELQYTPKDIAINGKLITAYDGILISENDFSTLENMRYTLTNPKAVAGMTKITANAQATYQKHRAGIHYIKRHPYENQIFYQAWDTNLAASIIHGLDRAGVPPAQAALNETMYTLTKAYASEAYDAGDVMIVASESGTYFYECIIAGTAVASTDLTGYDEFDVCVSGTASFIKRRGDLNGKFTYAPDGAIVFTNGRHNLHYGGRYYRVSKFINYDGHEGRDDFRYDYSDILRQINWRNRGKAVLHPTVNKIADCVALYSLQTNSHSSIDGDHDGTDTDITYADYIPIMNFTDCAYFNGSSSKISIPDAADWDFSDKNWSVDLWFCASSPMVRSTLISQGQLVGGDLDRWSLDVVVDDVDYPAVEPIHIGDVTAGSAGAVDDPTIKYTTSVNKGHVEFVLTENNTVVLKIAQNFSNATGYITDPATATDTDGYWGEPNLIATSVWHWAKITQGEKVGIIYDKKGRPKKKAGYFYQLTVDGITTEYREQSKAPANYSGAMFFGCVSDYNAPTYSQFFEGYMQDVRILSSNTLDKNTPPPSPWTNDSKTYAMIGSSVPIVGMNFNLSVPNASNATLKVYYWDKTTWTELAGCVDGTILSAGVAMSQSGTVTMPTNYSITYPSIYATNMLYWYKFEWTGLDAATELFYVSSVTEFQPIPDIWDGEYRNLTLAYSHKGDDADEKHWNDITTAIIEDDANSGGIMNPAEYGDEGEFKYTYNRDTTIKLSQWTSANELYLGTIVPLSGLYFKIPQDVGNSRDGAIMVYKWTGTWEAINYIQDDTESDRGIPLATTGNVTWDPNADDEWKTRVRGDIYLYFYKVQWTQKIAAKVFVDQIAGIPKPTKLYGWRFSQDWLGCLWLIGDMNGELNKVISGQPGSSCCFNGEGRGEYTIGKYDEFTGVGTLYSRYSDGAMETMVLTKRDEVWVLTGLEPHKITRRKVSDRFGCNAPRTFIVCDMGVDEQNVRKAMILWQSAEGIIRFDNGSLSVISGDIEDIFLTKYTTGDNRINSTYSHLSHAWYDPTYKEYHYVYAKGSATTPDTEMVYDVIKNKWFEIVRGSSCMLGITVEDIRGNQYVYGSFDSVAGVAGAGYIERLEFGNNFDGTAITCTLETADKPDLSTILKQGEAREVKIVGRAIATADLVTVSLYKDGKLTPTALGTINQDVTATSRFWQWVQSLTKIGTFTRIKMVVTGDDVPCCFEPLTLAIGKKNVRRETT